MPVYSELANDILFREPFSQTVDPGTQKKAKVLTGVYVQEGLYEWVNRRADIAGYLRLSNTIQLDAVLHNESMFLLLSI